MNENDLEQTIVQLNAGAGDVQNTADRGRIGQLAINEPAVDFFLIAAYLERVALDRGQRLGALQQIRGVTERIFERLRRFIGDLGKQTERGDIREISAVKLADVTAKWFAGAKKAGMLV